MAVGIKTGGRKKGTPNKKTTLILETCERLNFNPTAALISLITGKKGGKMDPKDRADVILKLMEFCYAKKKAIEEPEDDSLDVTPEFLGLLDGPTSKE